MGKDGIFVGKKKGIAWEEINMFLLEDLLNLVQEIWTGSGEEKAKKGTRWEGIWLELPFKCLKAANSGDRGKSGHKQYQRLF